jgi:hypothetical protein
VGAREATGHDMTLEQDCWTQSIRLP